QIRPKPPRKQRTGDWQKTEAKILERKRADEDRVCRLRAMTDEQFYRYVRRMGRRLDDPYAPIFRKAVRDEFARRGPDPGRALTGPTPATDAKAAPELVALDQEIASLRAQLAEMEDLTGHFDQADNETSVSKPSIDEGVFG